MTGKTKGKVVSIIAWREAKLIEENLEIGLLYQSMIGAIHEEKAKEEIGYCVVTYSVPAEDFPDEGLFWESSEKELFTVIRERNIGEFAPMHGGGVERYEFYDLDTDDVHVMYRIPFKPPN
ncbi:MAG: hypothetical protein PVG99_05555 [Desulfobacteraceae bacterium]|jgi:hypothetical protein